MAYREDYSTWTSCQEHGHLFVDSETQPGVRYCSDCHEPSVD